MIEVKYTEEERKLIVQMDNIDYRINKLKAEYTRERNSKYPNKERMKEMENQLGFYIKHRNALVDRIYGGCDEEAN